MSAPTRVDAWPSRQEGSMDSFDDWDILSPPSAPHSDDERDTVVVQHGAKDNNNNMECVEPRRASSVAAPGTPTGFSAGSFARADSNSDVDVADEFEDLDAGVISRFPPRHSTSSYSDAQQRLRNDMAEPAGVDQWLRLAEESLTAGASRAASDLVALLAVVKRGSSAKPNLPVEDVGTCTSTGEENLADSSENADILTRAVSSSVDDDDWRSLVRSLGPARFFLPLGIVLVTVCVVLVCAVSGGSVVSDARSDAVVVAAAASLSRGSCQVPTSSFDAGSIDHRLHGPHIGDCPAYADDHTRVHGPSNSRELPTREDSLTEDVRQLTAENDRLRLELASVAAELTSELDRVTLELDAVVRDGDVLRRQADTHLAESAVWKHSSEQWYDAYQRAREDCRAVAPWTLATGTKALARAAIGTVMRYGGDA
jgi:hypothetical protein